MKTTVPIIKKVGRYELTLRSDGMYSATDLQKLYNSTRDFGAAEKRLDNYFSTDSSKEYVQYLQKKYSAKQENLIPLKSSELEIVDTKAVSKQIIDTKRGRRNSGTFLCEELFIDFAMWLSIDFKDWAISVVKERLSELRNEAGDYANQLKTAISECYKEAPNPIHFQREFNLLNSLVFGNNKSNQRQSATKKQLLILNKIQLADIKMLQQGEKQKPYQQRERELSYIYKFMNENFDE